MTTVLARLNRSLSKGSRVSGTWSDRNLKKSQSSKLGLELEDKTFEEIFYQKHPESIVEEKLKDYAYLEQMLAGRFDWRKMSLGICERCKDGGNDSVHHPRSDVWLCDGSVLKEKKVNCFKDKLCAYCWLISIDSSLYSMQRGTKTYLHHLEDVIDEINLAIVSLKKKPNSWKPSIAVEMGTMRRTTL